ncbi:helix-turn-helix transcriptional regulator [Bacillus alveayuensis]|jgi:DNA-binding XRE family transcriptional regulator|uniref:helix-turn-helix transcriptional regulator n=1 Tax=Aeribacillus alveayuensis TaxID=279215 RepID=UPI0005CD4EE3|nr:helix-turn-helix domain-containing protein [Bacillus alveayuensis]
MDKDQLIYLLSNKMKLIRIEKGYTQDKMAEVLGISKKTLVQIEKGRTFASWTQIVALCALFRDSEIIESVLGDRPLEILETIAHEEIDVPKNKTLGGRVWWTEIKKIGAFRLQQNVISKHYRILDEQNYRWYSSFDKEEAMKRLEELADGTV